MVVVVVVVIVVVLVVLVVVGEGGGGGGGGEGQYNDRNENTPTLPITPIATTVTTAINYILSALQNNMLYGIIILKRHIIVVQLDNLRMIMLIPVLLKMQLNKVQDVWISKSTRSIMNQLSQPPLFWTVLLKKHTIQ